MSTVTRTALVSAGIRGLLCAGLATLLTGLFTWRFVGDANAGDWMASAAIEHESPST